MRAEVDGPKQDVEPLKREVETLKGEVHDLKLELAMRLEEVKHSEELLANEHKKTIDQQNELDALRAEV